MHVDEDMVRRLCGLARLTLEAEELGPMTGALARIFHHMDLLAQVPTPPAWEGVAGPNVLRPDQVLPSMGREALLALAPQTDGRYVLVPGVMEGET